VAATKATFEPYVVALTGGIASGKSTVSRLFEELGVPVIDTDVIARELVRKGSPLLARIEMEFGPKIIDETGELRRRKLREIIFSDSEKRARLESLLHPAILDEAQRRIKASRAPYCIVVIPLLAEIGVPSWVDRVLLVDASVAARTERLMVRDRVSEEAARQAIGAQASDASRRRIAGDIVLNEGKADELGTRVADLHRRYLSASAPAAPRPEGE
jgi:dephospho-CoA kinase